MTVTTVLSAGAALAAVLGLIWLASWLARSTRLLRPGGTGRLRLEQSLAIDTRRRLVLASCDGRGVLLLLGPQDQVVGWLPPSAS